MEIIGKTKLDYKQGGGGGGNIPIKKWKNYFQKTLNGPTDVAPLPENTKDDGPLDFPITDEELKQGMYILKRGKASGYDSVSYEMISCVLQTNPDLMGKLLNSILTNPVTIPPSTKKGPEGDPDCYRGISIMSCFAKYLLAILNHRLLAFVIDKNILSKSQLGFLPGNRTSDALLTLYNLIDYYCHKGKKYLYGCFVNFSKAFDSIPRHNLFEKLLKYDMWEVLRLPCQPLQER